MVQFVSEDRAVTWIARTVARANARSAPFVFVLGAGFSRGLVPTVKELLRDYFPATPGGRSAQSYAEHMAKPREERERLAREFWRGFRGENLRELEEHNLLFELDAQGMPLDHARAYQAIFDHRLSGGLNEPRESREFLRTVMRLEQPRLNTAHFFLAAMLGELRVLKDSRNPDGSYDTHFKEGVALSRLILTTNFDPFLQTALQFVGHPYYVSDRPELDLDDLEPEVGSTATHLVYVHGSIHRRSQISNERDIQRIKERNVQLLRHVFRQHGVIVLGYSGWNDAIADALAAPDQRDYRLLWCGLERDPLQQPSSYGPRVPEILAHPQAFYVPIEDAGAFAFRLCNELIGLPRLLTSPIHELRDRLESVNVAQVSVEPASGGSAPPTQTIEHALAQTRAGLARMIRIWGDSGGEAAAAPGGVIPQREPPAEASPQATPQRAVLELLRAEATTTVKPGMALAEVIERAAPGTRILLEPGTYEASLVIDKELELEGGADPNAVRIESTGAWTVIFNAERGRIAGLTLRQRGQPRGHRWGAIEIRNGELLLESCVIKSDGFAGIAVQGAETNPLIRDCHIRDCAGSGVILREQALGRLLHNYISHDGQHGVLIQDGANPTLTDNQIHHNHRVGVLVERGGRGHLEANEIFANGLEGVTILGEAAPQLVRNSIYENTKAGVYIFDKGKGELRDNVIRSNKQSGIALRTGAAPLVRGNQVNFNYGKGVWCADGAAGTVEGNDLDDNRFGSFWKSDDSSTVYSPHARAGAETADATNADATNADATNADAEAALVPSEFGN